MNVLRSLAAIAALALMLPAAAADKMVFSVQPTPFAAPSSVGLAKGYFSGQGLDLKSQWASRGLETIQLLTTGQADVGIAALTPVLAARAKGLPLVIIGLHSHGFNGTFLASKKNFGLTRLADFKGKKIGAPVGTGNYTVLLMAMKNAGLKPSDFQIANARVADMPAAMASNGFDAVLCWIPYADRIVNMGDGKIVMTPTQLEKLAGITYPVVLITTEDTIKKKPEILQRFMNAWVESERFVEQDRPETVRILRQALGDRVGSLDDKSLSDILYRNSKHDRVALSNADIAAVRDIEDFLYAQKNIKAKPSIAKLINNSFAKKAEATMK